MKRTLIHKPIVIRAYEFTGDVKEITGFLESINAAVGYDKYGWTLISDHEPPFLEIYDDEIDVRNILKGDFMTIDDEYGNISIYSRDTMLEAWELVEGDKHERT